MFILKVKDGFSLIELLVVIAIIGILAAVGTIGYSNYIESSKQKSLEANYAGIQKLADTYVELEEAFGTGTPGTPGTCIGHVRKIVSDNSSKQIEVNGVKKSIYVNGNCSNSPNIDEGQILIACEDPDASKSEIYVCACEYGGGSCSGPTACETKDSPLDPAKCL